MHMLCEGREGREKRDSVIKQRNVCNRPCRREQESESQRDGEFDALIGGWFPVEWRYIVRQRSVQQAVGAWCWQRRRQSQTDKGAGARSDRKAGRCRLSLPLSLFLSLSTSYHHHRHHDHDEIVLGSLEPWMHGVCLGCGFLALPWNLVSLACLLIQSRASTHTRKPCTQAERGKHAVTGTERDVRLVLRARGRAAFPQIVPGDSCRAAHTQEWIWGFKWGWMRRACGRVVSWNDRRTSNAGTGRWCIMFRMNGSLSGPGRAQSTR